MSHYRVFLIIFCLGVFISQQAHSQQSVVESNFCFDVKKLECINPFVTDKISLSQINTVDNGQKRIFFWTKIFTDEQKDIMHLWSKEGSGSGSGPVHITWPDQQENLSSETKIQTKKSLEAMRASTANTLNVQWVVLNIKQSPGFRTYSSILATPGKYSVRVYDLNGEMIEGGDLRSVEVVQ